MTGAERGRPRRLRSHENEGVTRRVKTNDATRRAAPARRTGTPPSVLAVFLILSAFLWAAAPAPARAWQSEDERKDAGSGGRENDGKQQDPDKTNKNKKEETPPPPPPDADEDWERAEDWEDPPLPPEIDPPPMPSAEDFGDDDTTPAYYSPPSSRQAQFVLSAAEKASQAGLFGEAATQYQRVLDEYGNKVTVSPDRTYVGVRAKAIDGLLRLPEEGKRTYLERYEPKARALLEAALASREKGMLIDVVRRYPLTVASRDALHALGLVHLERGEAAEARHYFEAAVAHPAADEATRLRARAALVLVASALEDRLALEAARSGSLEIGSTIPIRGTPRSIAELADEALRRLPATGPKAEKPRDAEWPLLGGDPSMNRAMAPAGDRRPRQWWQPIDVPLDPGGRYAGPDFGSDGDESSSFPPFLPVVGNGLVYVHTGLRVEAYQLYNGKLRWSGPDPAPLRRSTSQYLDRRLVFSAALDGDRLFAAIEVPASKQPLSWSFHRIVVPLPERRLFAFDAETGAVVWTHFDAPSRAPGAPKFDPETEEFARRASVVSPPTIVGDSVYVVASYFEGKILSFLCAFDKRTGRLRWRTLLCTGQQELNMFGQPWREYIASPIAEKDGVLFVSTNLGLVAAVERRMGAVLWLAPYPQIPIEATMNYQPRPRRPSWYSNPPVVEDGRVYVTPLDSDTLSAYDAGSGRTVFEVKRNVGSFDASGRRDVDRPDYRYLVGVRKGLILVAGGKVAAHDAETGRKRWDFRFPDPKETAVGRGGASESHLFFCGSRGIYTLDIETGKLVRDRVPLPEEGGEPGNLVSTGFFLVCASENRCQVFYQWDDVFEELKNRIASRPEDPALLLEVGNVYKQGRDFTRAIASFRKAIEVARAERPDHEAILGARRGLHDLHMTLGENHWKRGEYDAAEDEFRKSSENAHDEASRVRSYLAIARCHELKGDVTGLIGIYGALLREVPDAPLSGSDVPQKYQGMRSGLYALLLSAEKLVSAGDRERAAEMYQKIIASYPDDIVGGDSHARDFAIAGISALLRDAGPAVYARFEERARALHERASMERDEALFRQVLELYPNASVLERCLLELGNLLVEKEEYGKAAAILREFLLRFPGSGLESDVLESLAACYAKTGFFSSARAAIARTPEGSPARESLGRDPRLERSPAAAPSLEYPLAERWRRTFNTTSAISLLGVEGAPAKVLSSRLFFHSNRALTCVRLSDGEVMWVRPNVDEIPSQAGAEIHWVDGTIVVATQRAILSLDGETGDVRWQVDFDPSQPFHGARVVPGSVVTVLENPSDSGAFLLRAHDVLTGQKVWEDFVRGKFYNDIAATESYVVLHTQTPLRILVYDSFTGRRHMEIPAGSSYASPCALSGDRLFVSRNGEFQLLDLKERKEIWKRPAGTYKVRNVFPLGRDVTVLVSRVSQEPGQPSDALVKLDGRDGRTAWETPITDGGYVYPAERERREEGDTLYLNRRDRDSTFYLMAFSLDGGGLRWQAQPVAGGAPPKSVVEAGGLVVLEVSTYNPIDAAPKIYVVLVDAVTGKTVEQREYAGTVMSEVRVTGGTLCVSLGKQVTAFGK